MIMPLLQTIRRFFEPSPDARQVHRLYNICVEQARGKFFYTELDIPDTPEGRFEMIVLHVFLLMERLGQNSPPSRLLIESLIDDLDRNLREMGTGDISVGKKVKRLTNAAYARFRCYGTESPEAQQAMMAREIFREESHPQAATLFAYRLQARDALAAVPEEELLSGAVSFANADD